MKVKLTGSLVKREDKKPAQTAPQAQEDTQKGHYDWRVALKQKAVAGFLDACKDQGFTSDVVVQSVGQPSLTEGGHLVHVTAESYTSIIQATMLVKAQGVEVLKVARGKDQEVFFSSRRKPRRAWK